MNKATLLQGNAVYKETFDLPPAQKGTYVLRLVHPQAKAVLKVILK